MACAVFFVLYFRKSLYAWHTIFLLILAMVPLNLLSDYYGPAARHLSPVSLCIWIAVVCAVLFYLWNIKGRYLRYIEEYEATTSKRKAS